MSAHVVAGTREGGLSENAERAEGAESATITGIFAIYGEILGPFSHFLEGFVTISRPPLGKSISPHVSLGRYRMNRLYISGES